jgi:hypothetical protein
MASKPGPDTMISDPSPLSFAHLSRHSAAIRGFICFLAGRLARSE